MNVDALRFRTAQGKPGEPDLHQQRIGANGTARDDADRFAFDKAQFAQAFGNLVIGIPADDGVDDGGSKRKKFGEIH